MKEGLVLVILACAVASSFAQGNVAVCQGSARSLTCTAEETVTITSATYGRSANAPCPGSSSTTCSEDVASLLQALCTGMSECNAFATSMQGFLFSGMCPDNPQAYLEITYTCTPRPADYCTPDPCMNDGVCGDGSNDYSCNCAGTGYEGRNCTMNIDDCTPNSCMNGGVCEDGINSFTCNCAGTGYEGTNCNINIDDCTPDPCMNDGVCEDGVNSYTCNCTETGYEGTNCNIKALIACRKVSTTLSCEEGSINIETAVWGRSVLNECTGSLTSANLEDECAQDVSSYISDICDDMTSCTFKPKQGIFGGKTMKPCNKEKYLDLTYTCQGAPTTAPTTTTTTMTTSMPTTAETTTTLAPPPIQDIVVCNGASQDMTCTTGTVIICSAFFGRNGPVSECPTSLPEPSTACFDDASGTLGPMCTGMSTCGAPAISQFYYSPNNCGSMTPPPYLRVSFTCTPGTCP